MKMLFCNLLKRLNFTIAFLLIFLTPNMAAAVSNKDYNELLSKVATIEVQISAFEEQLRKQNGSIEELNHRIEILLQEITSLREDANFRFLRLEESAKVQSGAANTAIKTNYNAANNPPPINDSGIKPRLDSTPTPAKTENGAIDLYNQAMALLKTNNPSGAEKILIEMLEDYPQDRLAGNARYWLGETYYVRGLYEQAAKAFLDCVKDNADSGKVADSFLKLGFSLAKIGQKEKACKVFTELPIRYPNASTAIKSRAELEKQITNCK